MTNTREEVTTVENTVPQFEGKAYMRVTDSPAYKAGYQDGSKYVAGLVEALKAVKRHQEMNVKSNTTALMGTTWHIADKALNNLPPELRQ